MVKQSNAITWYDDNQFKLFCNLYKKGVHEHMPYLLDIAFVRQELQQVYKHLTNKQKNAFHTKIILE